MRLLCRQLVVLILLGAGFAVPASAAAQLPPRDLWPQVTAAVDSGDFKSADKTLNDLIEGGKASGIRRYPLYADSAASLARQLSSGPSSNRAASQWLMKAAFRLDPRSPSVAFTAADIDALGGNWGGVFSHMSAGFQNVFSDRSSGILARADLTIILCLAIFCAAAAMALVLFLRYGRPATHDFREMLGTRFGAGVASVIGYALLFLPIFLWLGPLWLILYWFLIFFGYAERGERVVIGILLGLMALIPIALTSGAYHVVASDSPAVRAAQAGIDKTYHPESLRRARELAELLPEESRLQLLLGNLEVQDGDEQQASVNYRRAIELNDRLAGAQLNVGNLHFFHNDFQAAISQYEKASQLDPGLAIAHYNHSLASGEIYKYEEQGRELEQAKKKDRFLVDSLISNPVPQKAVMYDLPLRDAYQITNTVARQQTAKELFANYATFNVVDSIVNTLTIGSLLSLVGGVLLWARRKRSGYAGTCMKCGRTFCHRCKSARESSVYCTQCIHIYLKRDGVSLDTKRAKLEEVQDYQGSRVRLKKLLSTFLPGSGQAYDGATVRGLIALILFFLFLSVAILVGRLAPVANPATTMRSAVRIIAAVLAFAVWLGFTIPIYRQRPLA